MLVAAYVEQLGRSKAAPTVKQSLAAIRMLFDWMVVGQVLPMNPAASVRGPKHVVKRGKTVGMTECDVMDASGSLVARASSTCLTLTGKMAEGR